LRDSLGEVEGDLAVRVKADTENMQAYDLYLKGRELFISRSDIRESVRLFELAVAQDPNFARGWEGLAAAASIAKSWGIDDRDYDAMVEPAAQRALDLDPSLSMAWAAKAQLESNREHADWAKALDFNGRAIEADPKNATAFLWRSIVWLNLGFFDRAFTDLETCLSIDPAYQNCTRWKAQALLYVGDEEQALAMFERGVKSGFVRNRAIGFVPALVHTGNTLAARLLLDKLMIPWELGEILLAALANPQAPAPDPKAIVARFDFSNSAAGVELGLPVAHLWLGAFGAVAETANGAGSDEVLPWIRAHPGWRNSAGFKKVLELTGVTAYWESHGYPPQCRAVGADDFTCDQAVP
jgi:tetratricopeptide (TPR) repeat protein